MGRPKGPKLTAHLARCGWSDERTKRANKSRKGNPVKKSFVGIAALCIAGTGMPATAAAASTATAPSVITVRGRPATAVATTKGDGGGDTPMFTIPADASYWQANWSYNCHPGGQQGSFDWAVNTPTGTDSNDYVTPNQLGWGYSAAERYYDHGTFYLAINADQGCVWSVQVVVPPTPTYMVSVDQTWRALNWSSPAYHPGTRPFEVRVTFHNDGPGAVTLSDTTAAGLRLTVSSVGHATWVGRPDLSADTYQCAGSDLATQLEEPHAVRPSGSLTGCVVFGVPTSVLDAAQVTDGLMTMGWSADGKTYGLKLSSAL